MLGRWLLVGKLVLLALFCAASLVSAGQIYKWDDGVADNAATGTSGSMIAVKFNAGTETDSLQAVRLYLTSTSECSTGVTTAVTADVYGDPNKKVPDARQGTWYTLAAGTWQAAPKMAAVSGQWTPWLLVNAGPVNGVGDTDKDFFAKVVFGTSAPSIGLDTGARPDMSVSKGRGIEFGELWAYLDDLGRTDGFMLQAVSGRKGDVDDNNSVNLGDALKMIRFWLQLDTPTDYELFEADMNNDNYANGIVGNPNLADALAVVNTFLKK